MQSRAMPDSTNTPHSLLIAGAMHVDEVATAQGKIIPAASNPVVWRRYVGGVAANAARAAQSLFKAKDSGGCVCLHAALGDDNTAQLLIASLQNEGVQISPQIIQRQATGRYSVLVDESGQMVLGLADAQLAEQLQAKPLLATVDSASAGTLLLDANLSYACIEALIESAGKLSMPVVALTVSPAKAVKFLPWADKLDLLFCNRREALAIASHLLPETHNSDELPLSKLAEVLVDIGFQDFVLTDAAAALLVRCQGVLTSVPVPPVVVDHNVNGAGDTLAGATMAAVAMGFSLEHAVSEFGLRMAADVLEGRRLPLAFQ